MVTVSVEATPRISRVEFNAPFTATGMVYGYSEVLLQEPAGGGSEVMRFRPSPMSPAPKEGETVTYGVMPSAMISRGMNDVMDETVEVDGATVTFKSVMDALVAFVEKWREEDANAPPPPELMNTPLPSPVELTPPPPMSPEPPGPQYPETSP